MTYDELAKLLDDIESGELERCPAARLLVFDAFEDQAALLVEAREAGNKLIATISEWGSRTAGQTLPTSISDAIFEYEDAMHAIAKLGQP